MTDDDLAERARHEIAEDRRVAALMRQAKNREALERRATVTESLLARVSEQAETLAEVTAQANSWQRHAQDADEALTKALAENERLRAAVGRVIRCEAEAQLAKIRAYCAEIAGGTSSVQAIVRSITALAAPVASLPPEEDR